MKKDKKKIYRLGISTCPNDTFMFDALIHNKIDTLNYEFELVMADVEELNKMAVEQTLDISKLSYGLYPKIAPYYQLLRSGSALGNNNGPLLISKHKIYPDELSDIKIAIPGEHTTANMLLNIAFPQARNRKEYLFSDIEEAILSNEVDAGVIIHETRFTYASKGLKLIADLGEIWEQKTSLPIPLGGIAIRRGIADNDKTEINNILKNSIEFAFKNPDENYNFVKEHAQDMNDDVMYNHIRLYVNNYSTDIGDKGLKAVEKLIASSESISDDIINNKIFID